MADQKKQIFIFHIPFSGYSRGFDVVEIEAANEEEARELLSDYDYKVLERETVRDDTESLTDEANLVT